MRICTANLLRVGNFLEILPFASKLILRCAITKYILQLRFLEIELAPVSPLKNFKLSKPSLSQ